MECGKSVWARDEENAEEVADEAVVAEEEQ